MRKVFTYPPQFPPGPRFPLPFIGELWALIDVDLGAAMTNLAKTYGEAIGVYMGNVRVVCFNSQELVVEALANQQLFYKSNQPVLIKSFGITE